MAVCVDRCTRCRYSNNTAYFRDNVEAILAHAASAAAVSGAGGGKKQGAIECIRAALDGAGEFGACPLGGTHHSPAPLARTHHCPLFVRAVKVPSSDKVLSFSI